MLHAHHTDAIFWYTFQVAQEAGEVYRRQCLGPTFYFPVYMQAPLSADTWGCCLLGSVYIRVRSCCVLGLDHLELGLLQIAVHQCRCSATSVGQVVTGS
jgi:hypothetical protein